MPHKFRELIIWQRAMALTTEVYALSRTWPKDELFGLTSQTRRAATSIALNIAEGAGNESNAEFARFLTIALRSSYELMTALELSLRLEYAKADSVQRLLKETDRLAAMTSTLIQKLSQSHKNRNIRETISTYEINSLNNDVDANNDQTL